MNPSLTDLRDLGGSERGTSTVVAPTRRWTTRVLLPGAIIVIVLLLVLVTAREAILPTTAIRVVPVIVKTVAGSAGAVTVQAPGWLEPDPHPYYVSALSDGVVAEVLVLAGEPVQAGQVVARLVPDDAQLAVRRAAAEVALRRAERAAAGAERDAAGLRLEHLIESTRDLAVADARVAEATANVQKVRADVAVEEARLAELTDEYDRKSRLTESQAVSEAAVARLRLRVDGQAAVVQATKAQAGVLAATLRKTEAELVAATTSRALLIDEHRAVALADAAVAGTDASVALAEASLDDAQLQLDRMNVVSPVNGIVMRRLAGPGSMLIRSAAPHAAHVVHVYDPRQMQIRVDVPLADVANIAIDQAVEIVVEVLPDRTFHGRVTRVVHEADIQKNTVEVKVSIDDPTAALKPEMLARAKFLAHAGGASLAGAVRQRLFAPAGLVRAGADGGASALVVRSLVDERGRVEQRQLTLGARKLEGWVEIASGLRVGDLLVADAPPGLEAGDRVRVTGELTTVTGG